jgi:hypothetical protein
VSAAFRGRCHLVYALAPPGLPARAANDALNRYIGDERRGIPVFHDHFTGRPHGGFAVFDVRSADELALLDEPGPLEGWTIAHHPLVFALSALGFAAQGEFTLEAYGRTTFEELRAAEEPDPRFWWREDPEEGSAN